VVTDRCYRSHSTMATRGSVELDVEQAAPHGPSARLIANLRSARCPVPRRLGASWQARSLELRFRPADPRRNEHEGLTPIVTAPMCVAPGRPGRSRTQRPLPSVRPRCKASPACTQSTQAPGAGKSAETS
jgi:hypothetical protein